MSRDKCFEWRMQGMYYAYDQIQKNGLEAFADELRFRKAAGVSIIAKTKKELDEYMNAVLKISLVFALSVLHDEFGFGKERCERFMKRYNLKTKSLALSDVSWQEQMSVIENELGIEVKFE